MRIDPAVVVVTDPADVEKVAEPDMMPPESRHQPSSDDVRLAFG